MDFLGGQKVSNISNIYKYQRMMTIPGSCGVGDNQPYVMCNKIIQIIISCPQPLCGFLLSHSSFNKHNLNKI